MPLLQDIGPAPRDSKDTSRQLESLLVKQLLMSSGVFKGGDAAGSALRSDLFAEALADAVAGAGGFGLAKTLEASFAPPSPGSAPVAGRVSSGFGARVDPINHLASNHPGVDFAAAEGTAISAASGGVVRRAGDRGGYGSAVEIDHGGGLTTLYAHASQLLVKEGQRVSPGEPIARVGHTGRTTGDHLHFEVRVNGTPVDPMRALKSYGLRADEIPASPPDRKEP